MSKAKFSYLECFYPRHDDKHVYKLMNTTKHTEHLNLKMHKITLFSGSGSNYRKDEPLTSVEDTGNGYFVTLESGKSFQLPYHVAEQLHVSLTVLNELGGKTEFRLVTPKKSTK